MKKWLCLLAALVAIPMFLATPAKPVRGQSEVEPDDYNEAYRIRVINEMGEWIRLKIVGFRRDANYRVDMDPGDYDVQDLYGGQRVLCVWNREGNLLAVVAVNINRNGKLRIRQLYGSAAERRAAAAGAADENNAGLPTLEIEEQ
jgi:hypothetical protein